MIESLPRRSARPWVALLAAVFGAHLLAAGTSGALAATGDQEVIIADTLRPAQLEIDAGTMVTWRNQDGERHRVRSKDGPVEFDSGNLDQDESFSFTFNVDGSYPYYDHRDREDAAYFGTIVVGGVALDPEAPLPETGSVSVIDRSFRPASIAIASGGSVEWSNNDGEAHTVTATDMSFDSGIVNGGAAFTQTFDQPGSYPYFCAIHPEMRGTITVSDPVSTSEGGDPAPAGSADLDIAPETSTATEVSSTPNEESALGSALTDLPSPPPVDPHSTASDVPVSVFDLSFQPHAIEVAVGGSVAWSNDDAVGHTVTAVDGGFNSGVMMVHDVFSTTFDTAGTYEYFCAIHPEMTGTITVTDESGNALSP